MQNKLASVKSDAMSGINNVAKEFDNEMERMTQVVHTPPSSKGGAHTLKIPVEAMDTAERSAYKPMESFGPKVQSILDDIKGVPGYSAQTNKIVNLTKELSALAGEDGITSLEKLQSIRQKIDALIKDPSQSTFKMSAYEEALTTLRRDIAEHIRDKMLPEFDKLRGSSFESLRNELLENNYKYAMAASAEDLLNKGAGRESKNRVMSLTDVIVGAGGLASGGP